MIKKLLKLIGKFLLLILIIILILGVIYLINPTYFMSKVEDAFYPTVNLSNQYDGKIVLETPEVYELMHVIGALSETSQINSNLLNKSTTYYEEVDEHFSRFSNHEIVKLFDNSLKENGFMVTYGSARFLSLTYQLDKDNNITHSNDIEFMRGLAKLAGYKFFTMEGDLDLIEDFAKKSDFHTFYKNHSKYYESLKQDYLRLCDFNGIREWLESKAPFGYNSYRVIYSPLTGGFHNTLSLKDKIKDKEQILMFVSPSKNKIDSLNITEFELESAWRTRVSFTEIDHNYVNPVSDKFLKDIERIIPDYKAWHNAKGKTSYDSGYETFNEYMTWGLFSIYAREKFSSDNIEAILKVHVDFMEERRLFHRFGEFNTELIKQYDLLNKPSIEELYPPMLDWMSKAITNDETRN